MMLKLLNKECQIYLLQDLCHLFLFLAGGHMLNLFSGNSGNPLQQIITNCMMFDDPLCDGLFLCVCHLKDLPKHHPLSTHRYWRNQGLGGGLGRKRNSMLQRGWKRLRNLTNVGGTVQEPPFPAETLTRSLIRCSWILILFQLSLCVGSCDELCYFIFAASSVSPFCRWNNLFLWALSYWMAFGQVTCPKTPNK